MTEKKPTLFDNGMIWGILLIGFGGLLLLQTLDIFNINTETMFALAFMGGGLAFVARFVSDRRQWWAIFPAFGLFFVGFAIGAHHWFPRFDLAGPVFLGGVGLAFLLVYLNNRHQSHWAIIPAGVLFTLACVASVYQITPRIDGGGIFFWGLAATFGALWALAPVRQAWNWALIVAAILFGFGWLIIGGTFFLKIGVPLVIIALGAFMLLRPNGKF